MAIKMLSEFLLRPREIKAIAVSYSRSAPRSGVPARLLSRFIRAKYHPLQCFTPLGIPRLMFWSIYHAKICINSFQLAWRSSASA